MRRLTRLGDEDGQAVIFTILCMTCLLGFVGFAADVGTLLRSKRVMQIAADSAAIAGAAELNYGGAATAGQDAAAQNGVTNGANGGTVTINTPPMYGAFAGKSGYVEAIVSQSQPTFFMKLFNSNSMSVAARAVATLGNNNGCVYTLGSSGADISITGNASILAPTCGIVDDSSSSNAMDLTGNINLDASSIGVAGGVSKAGNITVSPTPITGIAPAANPMAFLPSPTVPSSCGANPNYVGNITATLSQGCFNGLSATGNINITLNPGTYIINGNFNLTGNVTLTGTGVTLDLLGSTSIPGNANLNLSAPTSGTYNGVLFYQPPTNSNALALTGNSGAKIEGIVYAPNAPVTLTGNSGSQIYTDFVVSSLTLTGNASFQDYAQINGSSVLTSPRLVE